METETGWNGGGEMKRIFIRWLNSRDKSDAVTSSLTPEDWNDIEYISARIGFISTMLGIGLVSLVFWLDWGGKHTGVIAFLLGFSMPVGGFLGSIYWLRRNPPSTWK